MRFVESEERGKDHYSEESRSERLLEAFLNARAEVRTLAEELEITRRQKRAAEEHLRAIQSSRSWKGLTTLRHLKAGAKGMLDRLPSRLPRRNSAKRAGSSERSI